MKTFRVRATALTDLVAYFDVEAETAEEATETAEDMILNDDDDVDFQIADDGAAPIVGTEEVECVTDATTEEETVYSTVDSVYLPNAIAAYRENKPIVLAADECELATILAALRYWQRIGYQSDAKYDGEDSIANVAGTVEALTPDEIDSLCERINTGG
jgi:hypothetical protein